MKRSILILTIVLTMLTWARSQTIDDALRYSQIFYNGSARFNAMGGAFTSLGAELSSINMNPAGLGMFRTFEMSFSPQLQYHNTSTSFSNTLSKDYSYNFGLSNAGLVWPIISSGKSNGLTNLNFAYSYSNTNIFYENTTIEGINEESSMADYWANYGTNGEIYYKDLTGGAGIAFDAWIIDTITGTGGKAYGTIFSAYGEADYTYGQTQRRTISNYGYTGDHSLSIGGNISDKFFFGTTFSISGLRYTGHYEHLEADYDNVIEDFKNFTYIDHFDASGTGYTIKLGAVFKPVQVLRIGVAVHSPAIYRMDEYFQDNISSHFDVNDDVPPFENDPLRYSYTLTTPWRFLTGASWQLGKFGIISADYEYVDYSAATFSRASDNYNYSAENESVRTLLKSTNNLRFGAEFRISSFYLRGGYGYYGPAFREGEVNEDLSYNTYSGGVGFRQQSFYIDFAYTNQTSSRKYFMYYDPPYLEPATIHSVKNLFTTTFGFRF
jgi:hypothetical protein